MDKKQRNETIKFSVEQVEKCLFWFDKTYPAASSVNNILEIIKKQKIKAATAYERGERFDNKYERH